MICWWFLVTLNPDLLPMNPSVVLYYVDPWVDSVMLSASINPQFLSSLSTWSPSRESCSLSLIYRNCHSAGFPFSSKANDLWSNCSFFLECIDFLRLSSRRSSIHSFFSLVSSSRRSFLKSLGKLVKVALCFIFCWSFVNLSILDRFDLNEGGSSFVSVLKYYL